MGHLKPTERVDFFFNVCGFFNKYVVSPQSNFAKWKAGSVCGQIDHKMCTICCFILNECILTALNIRNKDEYVQLLNYFFDRYNAQYSLNCKQPETSIHTPCRVNIKKPRKKHLVEFIRKQWRINVYTFFTLSVCLWAPSIKGDWVMCSLCWLKWGPDNPYLARHLQSSAWPQWDRTPQWWLTLSPRELSWRGWWPAMSAMSGIRASAWRSTGRTRMWSGDSSRDRWVAFYLLFVTEMSLVRSR